MQSVHRSVSGGAAEAGSSPAGRHLHRDGWRRVTGPDDVAEGDIVQLLVPTICGWKGQGRVNSVDADCLNASKLDDPTDNFDCCLHEVVVKHPYSVEQ
jgi:hypothetical protein